MINPVGIGYEMVPAVDPAADHAVDSELLDAAPDGAASLDVNVLLAGLEQQRAELGAIADELIRLLHPPGAIDADTAPESPPVVKVNPSSG